MVIEYRDLRREIQAAIRRAIREQLAIGIGEGVVALERRPQPGQIRANFGPLGGPQFFNLGRDKQVRVPASVVQAVLYEAEEV
jgi:hypothetical protein